MKPRLSCLLPALVTVLTVLIAGAPSAFAFCGFYVSQGDEPLYNEASKVVLAWDDGRITVTMASDYRGEPKEFGLVVPVPVVVKKSDIRVVSMNLVDKLDAYSAPRLTEYYDPEPCAPQVMYEMAPMAGAATAAPAGIAVRKSEQYKVSIEAQYQVGVYDIVILKAEESAGLVRYLTDNHYRIPAGAAEVLGSYIAQNMYFFLAKVNLDRQNATGEKFLRPLQVSYRSPKFMLPLRLGTVNANGPQDLLVFALTRNGRVESVNYRTAQMPSHVDLPLYVRDKLQPVYRAAFERQVRQDDMSNVYTEYAWSLSTYCDPCSAAKPNSVELYALGARWQYPDADGSSTEADNASRPLVAETGFITRLHIRYDRAHFPEDLAFQETRDGNPYQVVYSIHHPATGDLSCQAGRAYQRELPTRYNKEATALHDLTGWDRNDILSAMAQSGEDPNELRGPLHQPFRNHVR
ncbi:MAG: DUF2330 domain-containing protein [Nevskia sp.]|nr:DUF2330 domain-containing protein [Nevskia sp.]